MKERPAFIRHYIEIQSPDNAHYPGSDELLCISADFGKAFEFQRLGVGIDELPPGRRTSWPHAHSTEEEFIYVVEGTPDVWLDGQLHRLKPGDGVGFPAGTGISHTFLNNTDETVRLLVMGERKKADDRIFYPLHPHRREQIKERWWDSVPSRPLGKHNGLPDTAS